MLRVRAHVEAIRASGVVCDDVRRQNDKRHGMAVYEGTGNQEHCHRISYIEQKSIRRNESWKKIFVVSEQINLDGRWSHFSFIFLVHCFSTLVLHLLGLAHHISPQ